MKNPELLSAGLTRGSKGPQRSPTSMKDSNTSPPSFLLTAEDTPAPRAGAATGEEEPDACACVDRGWGRGGGEGTRSSTSRGFTQKGGGGRNSDRAMSCAAHCPAPPDCNTAGRRTPSDFCPRAVVSSSSEQQHTTEEEAAVVGSEEVAVAEV